MSIRTARVFAAFFAIAVLTQATALFGQATVIRKSVKAPLEGDVTEITQKDISVKKGNDTTKVEANDIVQIQWKGEPSKVGLGRSAEKTGRYDAALQNYTESLADAPASPAGLKIDLQWAVVRVTAKLAQSNSAQVDAAITKLEEFNKANPNHYTHFDALRLLGLAYVAKADLAKARTTFDLLAKAPWKDYQLMADINVGKLLQLEGKADEAVTAFDKVIAGATPAEETQRQEALLGKAKVLTAQMKYPDASTLLDEVLAKSNPDEIALQAEAYVRQGDCFEAQNKTKEALLAYLHVDVLFPQEAGLHAESLYHLSKLWQKDGKKDRAEESRARLEELYPQSEWTRRLKAGT